MGQQLVTFFVFAIVARLIGPEQYGLVSLCYVFLLLAKSAIDCLADAVISMKIRDDLRLSTLFWAILAIGFILSLFVLAGRKYFSMVMGDERLAGLLVVMSPLPFLLSLASIPTALIIARMEFRFFAIRTILATVTGGSVGIYMAMHDYGAYSLLGQQLAMYLVINMVLWASVGWKPKLMFTGTGFFRNVKSWHSSGWYGLRFFF